ncbi:MAG: hypothetical protein FWB86_08025 [Treponema sp.]|nr:hypothetical protein [Treponema sp.]MCL2252178.1 hypothetical protein [Treponema sp.]
MMTKKNEKFPIKLNVITAIIGLLGAIFLIIISKENMRSKVYEYATIEISDSVTGNIYGQRLIKNNDHFSVEYFNSENNSLAEDFFKVVGKEIYSAAAHAAQDRSYTELNYMTQTDTDHILIINKERISLRDLCGRNTHITLYISKAARSEQ